MIHMTGDKVLVVTDLDETCTPFIPYFVPAMRTIVPKLARKLTRKLQRNVSMDDVSFELGRVMDLRGTHEYPWVWEESKFWQDPELRRAWRDYKQFRDQIVIPYHEALAESRQKNCKPFANVLEAADSLRRHGKKVVALSNGPGYSVRTKVHETKLDKCFDLVVAIELPEPPASAQLTDEMLKYGRDMVANGLSAKLRCPFLLVPTNWMKPDPRGLQMVMNKFDASPDTTIMIGDSLPSDGGVAKACGVPFLWAAYGAAQPEEYRKTVEEHFIEPERRRHKKNRTFPPMLTKWGASTWAEVLDHLGPQALPLEPTVLNETARPRPMAGPGH
jgi:FMN phosphatase YigB (HAD superfamily)